MKRKIAHTVAILFVFALFAGSLLAQSYCVENARIVKPVLSDNTRKIYDENLKKAEADYRESPYDADAIIWYGRRNAYLGKYTKAIWIYSQGIRKFPADARMYRHRGHRFISIRCFDDAIRDFEFAAKLEKKKPDQVEPDGLPNARNIPTSTLQSNIWYHLGLAHFVKGDFKKALKAYKKCLKVSKNPDMLVATTNWLYLTFRRLRKEKAAQKVLEPIKDDLDIIENDSYYKLLKVYQGKMKADNLLAEISDANNLGNASIGYGLGNWYLINGETEKATMIFKQITSGNQWSSFGYIAAEAELKRIR